MILILREDQICLLPISLYGRCDIGGTSEAFPFWFKQGANSNLSQQLTLCAVPSLPASLTHSDVLASSIAATCDDAGYFGEGGGGGMREKVCGKQ